MVLFEKFGQHQLMNRQAERYAKEGVEISLFTLADQVGACAMALQPLHDLIRAHVLGAERLHADGTTVPLMARGGTQTARLWTYLRDDRPFAGGAPPAALYYFSTDRRMEHPTRHLRDGPASCRPMLMAATTAFATRSTNPRPSAGRCAGHMPGASSSNWPTSRPRPARADRWPRRSRRSRWRPSDASTPSSMPSASSLV